LQPTSFNETEQKLFTYSGGGQVDSPRLSWLIAPDFALK